MNIACLLRRTATESPDRIALRSADQEISYGALAEASARFAGFLRERGLRPGERVAVWSTNCLEYLPVILGTWWAGGVAVPLNYLFPAGPLRHAVRDSGTSWVLAAASDVSTLRETLSGYVAVDRVLSLHHASGEDIDLPRISTHSAPLSAVEPRLDDEDALLMYTSGSTGVPKGVRQTHRNVGAEAAAVIDVWNVTADDHVLNCMPLFHVGGLQLCSLPLLLRGGTITFMAAWDPVEWLELVQRLRPSMCGLISTMLIDVANRVVDAPTKLDSLRVCMFGGSRTPQAPLDRFIDGTGVEPVEIYGQTEQSGLAVTYRPGEPRRPGSMGLPLSQILRYRLVAPVGEEPVDVGVAEVGELWVHGDAVTPGYWNLPELTEQRLAGGWFRTGDLMSTDADGYLYYVDRIDDMIVSGGENVYPQMVESQLASCPLIAELAVIGTAHERWVEQVTAVVVPSRPDVTAENIIEWCQQQPDLWHIHRPRRIEFVEALPRTGSGKLDRPSVRSMFATADS